MASSLRELAHNLASVEQGKRDLAMTETELLVQAGGLSYYELAKIWKALFYCTLYTGH